MKTKLFLLTLLIGLSAVKSFAQGAIDFNNDMVGVTDSLYQRGQTWGTRLTSIVQGDKDYGKLRPLRLTMVAYIDGAIGKLKAHPDANGSYNYRQAVLTYLQFEKSFVNDLLAPFELYNADTSTETLKGGINKLVAGAAQEKEYLEKVHVEQEAFAKANNFTIQKPAE